MYEEGGKDRGSLKGLRILIYINKTMINIGKIVLWRVKTKE